MQLFKKAKDVDGLSGALDNDEMGPDVAFSVLDAFGKDISVTYEELTIFAFAAYKERRTADVFAKRLAKAKTAKENMNKNLTAEDRRARDKAILEEFGKDMLNDDDL